MSRGLALLALFMIRVHYQGPGFIYINELKNSKPSRLVNLVFIIKMWLLTLFEFDRFTNRIEGQFYYFLLNQTPGFENA